MARGFNDLIDFLLSEIALCGDQGTYCSLVMVLRSVASMRMLVFVFFFIFGVLIF